MVGGHALSPAEQLGLLTWALARRAESGALPPEVPLRRLLGPIDADDDPQEDPAAGPARPLAVSLEEAVAGAGAASEACSVGQAVRCRWTRVGQHGLGPGG